MFDKVTQISIDLLRGERVTLEVQTLINDGKLEIFLTRHADQLFKTLIELIGALPTYNKSGDPRLFCPLNVLAHHLLITAGITSQQGVIRFCTVPGLCIEPDVVIGKDRDWIRRDRWRVTANRQERRQRQHRDNKPQAYTGNSGHERIPPYYDLASNNSVQTRLSTSFFALPAGISTDRSASSFSDGSAERGVSILISGPPSSAGVAGFLRRRRAPMASSFW